MLMSNKIIMQLWFIETYLLWHAYSLSLRKHLLESHEAVIDLLTQIKILVWVYHKFLKQIFLLLKEEEFVRI